MMTLSRRRFLQWTAALAATAPRRLRAADVHGFRPQLLPTQQDVWDQQVWMAKLGPKYTGNPAHTKFVDFLADSMERLGLDVQRDRYTFDRWESTFPPMIERGMGSARQIHATGRSRTAWMTPASSYFPYSGQTPQDGIMAELVYAGKHPDVDLSGVRDKIALVDFTINTRDWEHQYQQWSVHPADEHFPKTARPARAAVTDLAPYLKAGAKAVILCWSDVSNANAKDQYSPFSRPPQGIPALYVNQSSGASLRELAGAHETVTVTLTAKTFPNTTTDTIVATLTGASADEVIILNTHTDGPNATEENGALGLLALASYFSKIPKAERRRTIVFPMTTGHFASPWVPSIRGFITQHADVVRKAVAAVTVEHLGCREWLDVGPQSYEATGKNEWSVAITPSKPMAHALLEALEGSRDRAAIVNPVGGGFLGEGSSLSRAGIPTIGYIPQPNYLLAGPADGCIDKLDAALMHSQIHVFARLVHRIDTMSAADLKA
jgi:hypothetical protein